MSAIRDCVVARQIVVDMKMADLEAAEQMIGEEITADVVVILTTSLAAAIAVIRLAIYLPMFDMVKTVSK